MSEEKESKKLKRILARTKIYGDLKTFTRKQLEKEFDKYIDSMDFLGTIGSLKETIVELKKALPKTEGEEVSSQEANYLEIEGYIKFLSKKFDMFMAVLSNSIEDGARRIPSNIYNIKAALDTLSNGLRDNTTLELYEACKGFVSDISRNTGLDVSYTREDLKLTEARGFERGYEKGLKISQGDVSIDSRFNLLD